MILEFIELDPPEVSRCYHFPDGCSVKLENVLKIAVSPSGTHRLETADGLKHIVASGWYHIEINTEDWTF